MIIKILLICLFASTYGSEADKDLLCPPPSGGVGICVVNCNGDESCPAGEKCCGNCPRQCTKAVNPCQTVKCPRYKKCQINPGNSSAICVDIDCRSVKKLNCQTPVEYYINYKACLESRCSNCNCSDAQLVVNIPSSKFFSNKECVCVDRCEGACPSGYICELNEVQCIRAPCPPIPQCRPDVNPCPFGKPKPNVFCGRGPTRQDCPKDYECNVAPNDAYAKCCPNDPCKHKCAADQKCELVKVCGPRRCDKKPTCVTRECPLRKCAAQNCKYGFAFDENLCRTCSCLDPCKDKVCKRGKKCVALKAPGCTDRECPEYYGLCV